MTALVRSELLKLTSTRTALWLLLAEVLLVALLLTGALAAGSFPTPILRTNTGYRSLLEHGGLTALLSLVLGVLISANEFRHHTMVDSYLSAPRRTSVVLAKLVSAAAAGLVAGTVSAAVVVAASALWYKVHGVPMPLDATLARSLVGVAGWHIGYALLGVCLGFLLQSPAAAIVTGLLWVTVAETAISQIVVRLGRWLPATAARALGGDPETGLLPQNGAALVLLGWVLAAALVALSVVRHRDVD